MTPYVEARKAEFIPATFDTVTYDGKTWGVPKQSDAAFLYYRTDQVDDVPATWQEVYEDAAENDGIVYQGAAYEGLTCAFLEIAFAAGGKVLSDDGTKAEFDSPENLKALQFMVDGIKDGAAPKAVTTYMEEQARALVRGRPRDVHAQLAVRLRDRQGRTRTRRSSRSRRSRSSRAAARPASSAATTSSSRRTRRTRAARWR